MKKQNGFTLIELVISILIFAILFIVSSREYDKKHKPVNSTNYNDYTSKCIKGHKYMVAKNGDLRQLLNESQDPILCEDREQNSHTEVNNIDVKANPYKNQE